MEGRTIARPNPQTLPHAPPAALTSMEGRTIARPNAALAWVSRCRPMTSMEGRTIARPNPVGHTHVDGSLSLQWRAGQLPGQTSTRPPGRRETGRLQWRAGQLPGQTAKAAAMPRGTVALQWRAGQLPGQTDQGLAPDPGTAQLQWRAGQLPGQTDVGRQGDICDATLQWRAGQLPGQTSHPSRCPPPTGSHFNGGPDNCPAKPGSRRRRPSRGRSDFNGGPDNCPAKRGPRGGRPQEVRVTSMEGRTIARPNTQSCMSMSKASELQWRAGQLPGQTGLAHPGCNAEKNTSMEGRTIARPNTTPAPPAARRASYFNGGPDNCPAKPAVAMSSAGILTILQWRAGQLPGQTDRHPPWPMEGRTQRDPYFNGGPDNCPAKPLGQFEVVDLPVCGRLRAV